MGNADVDDRQFVVEEAHAFVLLQELGQAPEAGNDRREVELKVVKIEQCAEISGIFYRGIRDVPGDADARIAAEQLSDPLYFFSITYSVLIQKPWCEGTIYILPRGHFEQEAPQKVQGVEIVFPHWISSVPAEPVAKLLVGPQDFPFLDQIHGHNDQKLIQLAESNPDGFPWPEALES